MLLRLRPLLQPHLRQFSQFTRFKDPTPPTPPKPSPSPYGVKQRLTHHPIDEEITAPTIHLVEESGQFVGRRDLASVLGAIDRETHRLVQLSNPENDAPPVCKIISVAKLLEQRERDAENAAAAAAVGKGKKPEDVVKEVQVSWGISGNDLAHKLTKTRMHLDRGFRVEVMIAPKRRSAAAGTVEKEEMDAVVAKFEELFKENGAREYRPMEGSVGGKMMLYYQGKKAADEKAKVSDSKSRKEEIIQKARMKRKVKYAREKGPS